MVLKVVIQQSTFNITYTFACVQIRHNPLSGGYCGEVPPLPIPNREVKLTCADGTAMQCGRVGSRLLLSRVSDFERFLRLFCLYAVLLSYRSFIPQLLYLFTLLPLNPFYIHICILIVYTTISCQKFLDLINEVMILLGHHLA